MGFKGRRVWLVLISTWILVVVASSALFIMALRMSLQPKP
jgi:hypothetical protein